MKPSSYFSFLSYFFNFTIFCLLVFLQLYFFPFATSWFLAILLIFLIFTFFTFPSIYTLFLFLVVAVIFDSLTPYYLGLWTFVMFLLMFFLSQHLDKRARYSQIIIGEIVVLIFFCGLIFTFLFRHLSFNAWCLLTSYLINALLFAVLWAIGAKFNYKILQ